MAANAKHSDFVSKVRKAAADGVAALQVAGLHAQEYQLLGYGAAITADDFAGANADLSPDDLAAVMVAIGAVNAVLSANGAAHQKALLKAAR